jgi:hypothetical protein
MKYSSKLRPVKALKLLTVEKRKREVAMRAAAMAIDHFRPKAEKGEGSGCQLGKDSADLKEEWNEPGISIIAPARSVAAIPGA